MLCVKSRPGGLRSKRKYCQSWEQWFLIDKIEIIMKGNTSEEYGMVLQFYEVGILWNEEFPQTGIKSKAKFTLDCSLHEDLQKSTSFFSRYIFTCL